jgi:DNA polymerase III epsilon subunit-like protein
MYLFFDTETTGIPRNYKAPASDLNNWPRLVQVAWLLTDEEANEVSSAELLIKPEGFVIPMEATEIHGITTELARRNGTALPTALAVVAGAIKKASALVAHNMQFDEKILGAEFLRSGYPNPIESKTRTCTMHASTDYCRLPGPYGYKWPTLQELHMKLFEETFDGAHRALIDVRACARCYFELKRLKIIA